MKCYGTRSHVCYIEFYKNFIIQNCWQYVYNCIAIYKMSSLIDNEVCIKKRSYYITNYTTDYLSCWLNVQRFLFKHSSFNVMTQKSLVVICNTKNLGAKEYYALCLWRKPAHCYIKLQNLACGISTFYQK